MRHNLNNANALIDRQEAIGEGVATPLNIPKLNRYTVCNLRGGIGKTSLVFNLSYLVSNLLAVDTCPQANLSFFYDNDFFSRQTISTYDILLPYFVPGLGKVSRAAQAIGPTNESFDKKNNFFIKSSEQLYLFPSQMNSALFQARMIPGQQQQSMIDAMLYSLRHEIEREMKETGTTYCLIDTSPFFSGCTHLAWHATDALIVPVRTDQQSVNSLNLLMNVLSSSSLEFRRTMPSDQNTPKIQLVVLTHCGWSTVRNARNKPNQQTKFYIEMVRDTVARNITHFTTDNPDNHIVLLDDFLGSGRMSTALSRPINTLSVGDTFSINRVRTEVNPSVDKIKNQLLFIRNSIWN